MDDEEPIARVVKHYTEFTNQIAKTDATSRRFTIENDSLKDESLLQSIGAEAKSLYVKELVVIGLIYPTSEPFRGYALRIKMRIPHSYPQKPPRIFFLEKIVHPNIEKDGEYNNDYKSHFKLPSIYLTSLILSVFHS